MSAGSVHHATVRRKEGRAKGAIWIALALLGCLAVVVLNGRPLFYWDTAGYLRQGAGALEKVGIVEPAGENSVPAAEPPTSAAAADGATASGAGSASGTPTPKPADSTVVPQGRSDRTVDGSRSIFYSVVLASFAHFHLLEGVTLLHALVVLLAIWLPVRFASRLAPSALAPAASVAVPVFAACLGSMPFFVGYLMPDIFAPVLVISIAALAAFLPAMRWWEAVLVVGLGSVALVAHLSHLAIGLLLVPAALLVSLVLRRRGWVTVALALAVIIGAGFAQQAVIRLVAERAANSEVVILPFITARLIQDGVGYAYLEANCPDETMPTCKLYAALQKSDDPYRLTASHIVFERSERLGSFKLLPEEDQISVAHAQVPFFLDVLRAYPLGTIGALLRNTFLQSSMVSVGMTLPTDNIVRQSAGLPGMALQGFGHGNLSQSPGWLVPVTYLHGVYYALCLAVVFALLAERGRIRPEIKAFVLVLLLGMLANAFVCGAISQPATRYGSRMIWLLPFAAAVLLMFRQGRRA